MGGNASQALEDLEVDLLLEGVYQHFGYDLRGYQRAPLKQRLRALMRDHGLATVSALQERVLHDELMGEALLRIVGSNESRLFDDPQHLLALRASLGGNLRSFPEPKVWVAECPCARAVWTLAILLDEALDGRAPPLIFATGASALQTYEAQSASVSLDELEQCEESYAQSGGNGALARYFDVEQERATLKARLRQHIAWAQHNLVTDASFNEFQLIVCRGVLADFGPVLQRRTLQLFDDSMASFGLLSVDEASAVQAEPFAMGYRPLAAQQGVYKRTH
jgi:chemotaxis protein methyltransferase CheR